MKYIVCVLLVIGSLSSSFGQIVKGKLDLRNETLTSHSLTLDGEWEFYWEQMIAPENVSKQQSKDYYRFPQKWNDGVTAEGTALSNHGFATYVLTIFLPKQRPVLGFYINNVNSAANLFVNGEPIDACGTASITVESNRPEWVPKVLTLPDADTLQIVMQIANFEHVKGGARRSILLGDLEVLQQKSLNKLATDLVLNGIILMTGFFFLGLFAFGLNRKPAFFFGVFCLLFSLRIIGADDYALHTLFPHVGWLFYLRLEYLSLFVPPIFFSVYTHHLFPFEYRVNPFYITAFVSAVFAVLTLVLPSTIFTGFVETYLVILLFAIVTAGWVYIRAFKLNLVGSKYAIFSSISVLAIFGYNIFLYLTGVEEKEYLSFFGYLGFFFFQSLVLFYMFTNSLKEAKINAENAARSKSDFLSMMSHEIRTPMNAVIGLSNYLLEEEPKKEQVETLETLKFSAQNLLVIINDILDLSKIEANKIEFDYSRVKLSALLTSIQRVFKPIAEGKSLSLIFETDANIPDDIECDETRTSQILTNLISNALKFTEQGHVKVKLSLENLAPDFVAITFSVEDTGIGIEKDRQEDIFNSFTQASTSTTRKFGGTGLGLAITKKLLNLQGCELHLYSVVGQGSKFYFTQKFKIISDASTEQKVLPDSVKKLDVRVLLVEDNEVNIMVAEKYLKRWGVVYDVAKNGALGLEAVKKVKYDVVLMDLQMPVMDGYTAVKEMRKIGIKVPIIALTASALLIDRKKIHEAGMNDFVIKPFNPDNLFDKLLTYQNKR